MHTLAWILAGFALAFFACASMLNAVQFYTESNDRYNKLNKPILVCCGLGLVLLALAVITGSVV